MLQAIVCLLALLVITVTMFLSAADFKLQGSWRWTARRVAFVAAGSAAVGLSLYIVFGHYQPGWLNAVFYIGIALFLFTNPMQIPWHQWVWKGNSGGVT